MKIYGLNKTTLLDFPGRVAATIFTGGCNFRCPFCQNGSLVLNPASQPFYPEEEIFSFLARRRSILDGVCITGGEPSLQADLPDFIRKVKGLGLAVKLDTNGYRPDVLQYLFQNSLIDALAMDIKNSPERYAETANIPDFDFSLIERSVSLIMRGPVPYEFRTTVVKELHAKPDIRSIGRWLKGANAYFLQSYQDSDAVLMPGFHAWEKETLLDFQSLLLETIPHTFLRGVD